jgi:hypothetical protein
MGQIAWRQNFVSISFRSELTSTFRASKRAANVFLAAEISQTIEKAHSARENPSKSKLRAASLGAHFATQPRAADEIQTTRRTQKGLATGEGANFRGSSRATL